MRGLTIVGVDVFLEKRTTRIPVGVLRRENGKYIFRYNERYFRKRFVIPLGVELPLLQREFASETLFPTFEDRIPCRENPAYPDYCWTMGIDVEEKDPLILLGTIGRRGPSSFIFYPVYERKVDPSDLIFFRNELGLTTREFASVFELSQASLNAFERGRSSGKEIRKRLEIILYFPEVALDFLFVNEGYLLYDRWEQAVSKIKERLKSRGDLYNERTSDEDRK